MDPRITPSLVLTLVVATASGCGWLSPNTVPYTERMRPQLVYSEDEMATLGAESYAEVLSRYPVVRATAAARRVDRVGRRIAEASGKKWSWEFHLLDEPDQVNAFCLPGGKIAVFTGLLPYIATDSDMAVVLGHETAHAVLQHSNERMSKPLAAKLIGLPTSLAVGVWGSIAPGTRKVVMSGLGLGSIVGEVMPYSQKHEIEADEVGLIFMQRAGYDLASAPAFWRRMEAEDRGRITDALSSHPSSAQRAADLERRVEELEGRSK